MRRLWVWLRRIVVALVAMVALLLAPVAFIELACTGEPGQAPERTALLAPEHRRAEANSYLTYPEWHIVYAYEGLAHVMEEGDEHAFPFLGSIAGFWRSACALSGVAAERGGADFATRATMHTIGVSFTAEMLLKGLYEETVGRLFAALRGAAKTAQDEHALDVARDYALFLRETPWYRYDFDGATAELRAIPPDGARAWERRLALGAEWQLKAAYARAIAAAVETVGPAALSIRSVVEGIDEGRLAGVEGVRVVDALPSGRTVIETPRYRAFTDILLRLAREGGGKVVEIAGNDAVLVTLLHGDESYAPPAGRALATVSRDGFGTYRTLVDVPLVDLLELLAEPGGDASVEHVYDY